VRIQLTVELDVNPETGIPFVERPAKAFLECRVLPASDALAAPQVNLQGNAEGLRWLAEMALAAAAAKPDGYHRHVGEEEGLRGGVELILGRAPRR
jgi:hypothetical protein